MDLPTFDIRNFIDQLTPAKEKNKYICPHCEGHNLSIHQGTGKYQCWNGCTNQEIREAIKPWSEVREEFKQSQSNFNGMRMTATRVINKPAIEKEDYDLLGTVKDAKFPPSHTLGLERYIDFTYSQTQVVRRTEENTTGVWRKKKNGILPWHQNAVGQWETGKGLEVWLPYCFYDIQQSKGKWVLLVEGEKCVEYAKVKYGLAAFTFQGGSWGDTLLDDFQKIKDCEIAGIICWPDHDDTGYKKAVKCREICISLGIPFIQLDPLRIWAEMPEKGDIADYWKKFPQSKEYILKILLQSIKDYSYAQLDPLELEIIESLKQARPKVERLVKEISKTHDPIEQGILKQMLSSQGYNQTILDAMVMGSNTRPVNPPKVMTAREFLDFKFPSSGWIYPELVPDSGVLLLSGLPGSMKTMFAYAAFFSYLAGEKFLQEELSRSATMRAKKGLIINADQQSQEGQLMCAKNPLSVKTQELWHVVGGDTSEEKWNLKYLPWLEEQVKIFRYSIMIVDSYAGIHAHLPEWNENAPTAAAGINALKAIAEKYSIAIIVIHHDGKREDGSSTVKTRGSTAIPGAASGVMNLTRTKEDKDGNKDNLVRFLEISKFRNANEYKHVIKFNPQSYNFELLPSDGGINNRQTLNNLATTLFTNKFMNSQGVEYSIEELLRSFNAGVMGDRKLFLGRVLGKLEQRGVVERVMRGENIFYRYKQPFYAPSPLDSMDLGV